VARGIRRFPRIFVPREFQYYLRILRLTYNRLALKRNPRLRYFTRFDVFHTKWGDRAKCHFIDLAMKLKDKNIDPALYLKIMCRYGRFKDSTWMPRPGWLAKSKTIKIFHWLYRKEVKTYDLRLQFKKEISGWSDLDIYSAVRDSSKMYRDATEKLGLHPDEASVLLKKDLSPWYLAISLLESKKEGRDFKLCLDVLRRDKHLRKLARKAYRRRD